MSTRVSKTVTAGLIAVGISGAILVGASAFAAGDHGDRGGRHHRGFGGIDFEQVDANGDGTITQDEMLAAAGDRFQDADSDGDGIVSLDEFTAAEELLEKQRRQARAERMFDRLDANDDGELTQDELETSVAERFDRMDRNGDGELTPERPPRN